jgi:hypothetical protein
VKHQFQDWLKSRLPLAGLVGWCARLPDHSLVCQSSADWLSATQLEQALARAANAAEGMQNQHPRPERFCWTFDNLRLYFVAAAKGSSLALFVENRPDSEFAAAETLLDEFANRL